MKRKLLLLAGALSLSFAMSAGARPPLYIICDSCTTQSASIQCKCTSNSLHPNGISNCASWVSYCWNGNPP